MDARYCARVSLEGRVALVTGAARGIGRAIALALARAGADVAVGDVHLAPFTGERYYRLRERRSGADEETPTADAVSELGRRGTAVEFDVSDPEQVRRAVAQVESDLGPVDVLANNAGIVNNLGLGDLLTTALRYYVGVLAAVILLIATNAGLIGVSRLIDPEMLVEIEATAVV